ncbi:c-type cytochrome [Noviherbaspirillum galbum]|uniref:Cytochrome c n=1 Tax=Noviherbaspirillum galbum TaxID=2709383 RepID=A0A6B3SN73_9BURK|nr:cytochrome c [Noviherbaspirillum galbum]NEX61898.1 cytochrome c [Noviherbaspirillum galbum]
MTIRRFALAMGVAGVLLCTQSMAQDKQDPKAGKEKAQSCAMCHGNEGMAQMPNAPHLAGQPTAYLAEQLKAFRSGARKNEIMSVIAKPLSDADIDNLAAYYSSFEIQLKR